MNPTIKLPLTILAAAQPLDIITTAVLLNTTVSQEANPITAAMIGVGGLGFVLAAKLALVLIIGLSATFRARTDVSRARRYVLVVAGIYTAVVCWNASLMLARG